MSLVLLNLDSNQQIKLDNQNPLIIGRKNVEGCFDKRVSRNHGRVTCTTDGKLRLEALHFNPCFFTRNGVPPVLQLNKDEEETLSEGDYLGLLPNAYWFKITSDKVIEVKIRPDNTEITSIHQGCEENIKTGNLHDSRGVTNSEADKAVTIKIEGSSVLSDEVNEGSLNPLPPPPSDSVINSTGLSKGFGSAEFEKTRRLPLWMYEIYDPMDGNKSSNKRTPNSSEKEKKQKPLTVAEADRSSRGRLQVNGKGTDLTFATTSTAKTEDKPPNTATHSTQETDKHKRKHGAGTRITCEHGATCYTQNSQHRAQFSHPGDEDYIPKVEQPVYNSTSRHPGDEKKHSDASDVPKVAHEETEIPPQPLKRSKKKTKVHSEYDTDTHVLEEEDVDEDDDEDNDDEIILDTGDEVHDSFENLEKERKS